MAKKALEGIRVLELGPYVALPMTGRILASLGAEVIKVETNKVLDEMAFIPAWSRGAGQPEFQRLKRRLTLDVRTPKGRDLFMELVKVSDVYMTNFRRSILERWGVDFPQVREVRPDIIIMWQTGLGGQGPYYTYKSYGILVQHMSGVSLQTGFPGSPPGVVNTSYSDYHTGVFQPAAVIGALIRRQATGRTTTMESSIFKSGGVTAGPPILDYQVNNRLPEPSGNRDPRGAPHGVYPCEGDDRYCAIAVFNDEEWRAFCGVLGNPDWTQDPRFATSLDRVHNQDGLDDLIAQWTRHHAAQDVMERMQGAGVAASVVSQGQDLYDNPHLKARDFYREVTYYEAERGKVATEWKTGPTIVSNTPVVMSETPMEFGRFSNVGEDSPYVLQELLGMDPSEIERLVAEEVVY